MPSVYQLKPRFQALLRPLTNTLARAGVTANQITLLAMLLSLAVAGTLTFAALPPQGWLILPVLLFVRMALNAIDGMLAREHGQQSALGGIYNEVCDIVSDTALFIPFALLHAQTAWLVLAVAFFAVVSEYIGVLGPMLKASRRYDGPMGKSDRATLLGALALVQAFAGLGSLLLLWAMLAMLALLLVTCVNRARQILREVQHD
ncbi:CDP-alcohol phosphatidyltransferase family protein [Chitinilyticum piscinae]|uniref:CDP-alcohol phosphatidyltransferase family protein n=1 Tax=Chitinilyticum piscinae TaxID=2866724 RepID=A0A8J7FSV0_9NEIS|nr:CDP-alcohol phosphatidyltransferase family protein [Chitinilyticum piscinae]MBE9609921.1 CDP-alcohol phosphatidyltransferase family protein [Chitinilyticum piscinae]